MMNDKNQVDQHSELFRHNWTRPKRSKSQVNGHTVQKKKNSIKYQKINKNLKGRKGPPTQKKENNKQPASSKH
jgi:hypothetical protein